MTKTLLPTGCYDLLPPQARQESELSSALLTVFESFGYEQVSPPLLEYSDSLLAGRGAILSPHIFRVMDANMHKVMGIRPDITLQVARIAASRLAHAPRPLRLCYNGLILRMLDEQLKNERQLRQAGIELIGAASPEADAEVIVVAAEALKKTGITKLSIDLNLPGIVGSLLASENWIMNRRRSYSPPSHTRMSPPLGAFLSPTATRWSACCNAPAQPMPHLPPCSGLIFPRVLKANAARPAGSNKNPD